jgi:predicted transcriptional regulator
MNKLTKVEEEIMQLYWDHGANTVSAIIELMEGEKPPHSSVSSIARILEKKDFLSHNTYGRTYEYFPIISKKDYTRFSIKTLVSNYFEGSMNDLVSFLVKEEDISIADLSKLNTKEEKK